MTIKGGVWTNKNTQSLIYGSKDDVRIYSGEFNKDPANYVVDGCTVTEAEGIYTVLMTITVTVNESSYGSVDVTSVSVPCGSVFTVDGNKLTVNGTVVTATPAGSTAEYTYSFDSWSVKSGAVAEEPMTVTVTFVRTVNTYTVTFVMQGHGVQVPPQTVEYNQKASEPTAPTDPMY